MNTGVISEQKKKSPIKITRDELKKQINKKRAYDEEMLTGIFHNKENPRSAHCLGVVRFTMRIYEGEDPVTYELYDGERYTLPRMVVNHLNRNCYYRHYKSVDPKFGNVSQARPDGRYINEPMREVRKEHRFHFERTDFDAEPELDNEITIVEKSAL